MNLTRLFQFCAWGSLAAIGALSMVSPSLRPVTALPHDVEHAAIFALAGLAVALGYSRHAVRHMIMLTAFSAAVELAQLFVPGRHARISDFLVDAAAACAGVLLALAHMRFTTAKAAPHP
jgi:VanZ family protein